MVLENAPLERLATTPGEEPVLLTLADHGLTIWVSSRRWPQPFPLPRRRWDVLKADGDALLKADEERARISNAVVHLMDPIDGPDGEA
jgi:hypothetical protein